MSRDLDDETAAQEALDAELFAPGLLHELKQPLMGADAAATLLERSALAASLRQNDDWRLLRSQLARLAEIVNGYEDLFSPGHVPPSTFRVAPVVSRAVDLLAHRVRPLARRFVFRRDDRVLEAYGRPVALVHATTNLIANALDAIEGLEGERRIEVRVLEPAGRPGVEVRVSDEGAGIPDDVRARIFEPRFTTKAFRRGTGLGLHISRRLMAQNGGEVYLVPEEDSLRLPWAVTEFAIAVPAAPPGGTP